jgi:hypothetical protein
VNANPLILPNASSRSHTSHTNTDNQLPPASAHTAASNPPASQQPSALPPHPASRVKDPLPKRFLTPNPRLLLSRSRPSQWRAAPVRVSPSCAPAAAASSRECFGENQRRRPKQPPHLEELEGGERLASARRHGRFWRVSKPRATLGRARTVVPMLMEARDGPAPAHPGSFRRAEERGGVLPPLSLSSTRGPPPLLAPPPLLSTRRCARRRRPRRPRAFARVSGDACSPARRRLRSRRARRCRRRCRRARPPAWRARRWLRFPLTQPLSKNPQQQHTKTATSAR